MIIQTKNNKQVLFRRLIPEDYEALFKYLQNLSPETKNRFGPHSYDRKSILEFYENSDPNMGYIAIEPETSEIVSYCILKLGFLEHDRPRLQSYGLVPDAQTDCTFAPSVADAWQSLGLGDTMFQFILSDIHSLGMKRIILWGGVQSHNTKAMNYYIKLNFKILGEFEYQGRNYDMMLEIG